MLEFLQTLVFGSGDMLIAWVLPAAMMGVSLLQQNQKGEQAAQQFENERAKMFYGQKSDFRGIKGADYLGAGASGLASGMAMQQNLDKPFSSESVDQNKLSPEQYSAISAGPKGGGRWKTNRERNFDSVM